MNKLNILIAIAYIPLYLIGMQSNESSNSMHHSRSGLEETAIQFNTSNVNIDPLGKSFRKQLLKTTQSSPSWPQINSLITALKEHDSVSKKANCAIYYMVLQEMEKLHLQKQLPKKQTFRIF